MHLLIASSVLYSSACRPTSGAQGVYTVAFTWNDSQKTYEVSNRSAGQVSSRTKTIVISETSSLIAEQLRRANLQAASGTLQVTLSGSAPYLVSLGQFTITSPDILELRAAVELEDVERIKSLISRYHNVNQRELPSQRTSLYMAVAAGKNKSLKTLLDLGADPNIPDYEGETPFSLASATNNAKATQLLRDAGARK